MPPLWKRRRKQLGAAEREVASRVTGAKRILRRVELKDKPAKQIGKKILHTDTI